MQTEIGVYDPETRTIAVTFTKGEIVHRRSVNACHGEDGAYDAAATEARVGDVAAGVAVKIAVGAIVNATEPGETQEPEAA